MFYVLMQRLSERQWPFRGPESLTPHTAGRAGPDAGPSAASAPAGGD
jgi:hypothetical protein